MVQIFFKNRSRHFYLFRRPSGNWKERPIPFQKIFYRGSYAQLPAEIVGRNEVEKGHGKTTRLLKESKAEDKKNFRRHHQESFPRIKGLDEAPIDQRDPLSGFGILSRRPPSREILLELHRRGKSVVGVDHDRLNDGMGRTAG